MVRLATKIKAGTLLETLVALIIVMLSFAVGLSIYFNVLYSNNQQEKVHAANLLQQYKTDTLSAQSFFDGEEQKDNIKVEKKILEDKKAEDLISIEFNAYNTQGRKLISETELILLNR